MRTPVPSGVDPGERRLLESPAVIVDFHTHIMPPEVQEQREDWVRRDATFRELYGRPGARFAGCEDLLASMEASGVNHSVVLNYGWQTHELCALTNDYIMQAVSRYPHQLSGFGAVQPREREAALRELERCSAGGLRGLGELRPDLQGFALADAGELWRRLEEWEWPLSLHVSEPVGHHYPGKGGAGLAEVCQLAQAQPDLRIICAHWGGGLPFYALMPEVAQALGNVYFDSAASDFLYRPQVFAVVAELVGAEKVLFGSDFSVMRQKRQLRSVERAGLSLQQKSLILGENAVRLLGLPS